MKSLITLTAVLAAMLSVSAAADALPLDASVKPAVTRLANPAPKTGLYVGNSFTYYNCGLVGYVRGFAKAAGIPWRARQITISSGRLSYHPMAQYLAPHELDPYAKGRVKDGKLTAPMFDVVFIQALSTEPIDAKSIPTWKKYLKSEIAEVKAAGLNPWWSLPGRKRISRKTRRSSRTRLFQPQMKMGPRRFPWDSPSRKPMPVVRISTSMRPTKSIRQPRAPISMAPWLTASSSTGHLKV